jgi:U8 snoRNA-decapping enzyme
MQMRFDGKLGFTGGIVENGETAEFGVGREMQEELGVDPKRFPLSKDHLIMTQPFSCATLPEVKTLYFYALEVQEEEIMEIEKNARHAVHFGEEVSHFIKQFKIDFFLNLCFKQVLGWIRVPLYTMKDSYSGFPAFLENNFVGNARQQLIEALIKIGVMSRDEIDAAMLACISNNSKQ